MQILEGLTVDAAACHSLPRDIFLFEGALVQSEWIESRVVGNNWVSLVRSERARSTQLAQLKSSLYAENGAAIEAREAIHRRKVELVDSPDLPCEKVARRIPPVRPVGLDTSGPSASLAMQKWREIRERPAYTREEEVLSEEDLLESEEEEEEEGGDVEQGYTDDKEGQPHVKQEHNLRLFWEYPDNYRSSEEEAEDMVQEYTEDERDQPRVKQEYNIQPFGEEYPDNYSGSDEDAELSEGGTEIEATEDQENEEPEEEDQSVHQMKRETARLPAETAEDSGWSEEEGTSHA